MVLKKLIMTCIALCISAVLATALCGCDDLGAYEDSEEYYDSFESVFLLSDDDVDGEEFSVEDYFYNDDSRENFLTDKEGNYNGVEYNDYSYMAIPFDKTIEMDTLALYLNSDDNVTVYISVYVTDKIPTSWKPVADNEGAGPLPDTENSGDGNESGEENSSDSQEKEYDDPDPETRIGNITVSLKKEEWNSFLLDYFNVNGLTQKSIKINEGQYVLLQFRNNSGVRVYDPEKQCYVDPDTGLDLPKAEITMTNLLIRALDVENKNEARGGE